MNKNEILKKIEYLNEELKEVNEKIIKYDIYQASLKLLMNSLYGTFGNRYSPFYDIDAAASVTLTGQACIKESSDISNKFLQEKYGVEDDCTIYGDTDSEIYSTKIRTDCGIMQIGDIFENTNSDIVLDKYGHEIKNVDNLNCLTFDSTNKNVKMGKIKKIIRHKTTKKKYKICVNGKEIIMTEDHGCMVLRDNKLIRVPPKDIENDDEMITIFDKNLNGYTITEIDSVECIGDFDDEYVYDIEMEDDTEHTYFANDILVHNSVYITIAPVLEKINKSLLDENGDVTKDAYKIAEELEEELNSKITSWAKRTCNIEDPRFVFKRETICNSGLFLEKKRYILNIVDDEGLKPSPEKEMKYVGVEVVGIKIPKKVKPLIKEVSNVMMKTRDKSKTDLAFKQAYEKYLEFDVEDIATPVSVNTYDKYAKLANGLVFAKGTPKDVKASIAYNFLLNRLNLNKKYEAITSGDSVNVFYVQKNKYNINGIAFKDIYPKEFNLDVDKVLMFNKNVVTAVERLYDAVGWSINNPTRETVCDLLELLS